MLFNLTEKKINIESLDSNDSKIMLEEVPIYLEEGTNEEYISIGDILNAEERRIAKKYKISEYNIFELALIFADVKQRTKSIKQKFRFNKMLFYLSKALEEQYGKGAIIFDDIVPGRSGPIPKNLKNDIQKLQQEDLIDVYLEKDGKKVSNSRKDWEKFKDSKKASIVCTLTKKGEALTKDIWNELDIEMKKIIIKIKEKIFYMDTEQLKDKVHKEFPELRKIYTQNDEETFEYLLI